MKMFRSFDDNYDGQLQTTEFRNALRYMGAKDIHSLMKELDPEESSMEAPGSPPEVLSH